MNHSLMRIILLKLNHSLNKGLASNNNLIWIRIIINAIILRTNNKGIFFICFLLTNLKNLRFTSWSNKLFIFKTIKKIILCDDSAYFGYNCSNSGNNAKSLRCRNIKKEKTRIQNFFILTSTLERKNDLYHFCIQYTIRFY